MELDDLAQYPQLAPLLAEWHVREWQHLYPEWTVAAARAELDAMTSDGIPHTIVAFAGSGRLADDVLGSVSLIADDELPGFEHVGPWLASLFVRADARGAGVGRSLVGAAVRFAHDHGAERLHLFNTNTTTFYERLGWRPIARTEKNGHEVNVMAIDTGPHAPRRAFATDWCTSPWFRGAYSYLRGDGAPEDRDAIGRPVAPGLVLAGEAASREHPGTAHGAWFSGERAARLVCDAAPARVVVVGAGLAGIAAARTVRASGAEVVVLEATSRLGGRATASRQLGGPVNVGAAWIHGTEGHPLFDAFARRNSVAEVNTFRKMTTFLAGHGELGGAELARLDRMHSAVSERIEGAAGSADPGAVVADVLDPAIADIATDPTSATVLRSWMRGEYENLYAAPPADLSLRHHSEPFRLPGDDVMITVGLDEIVAELADGLDVRFDSPVSTIVRSGDQWRVSTAGGELLADAVIVTVSIGVLRSGTIRFDPPLPVSVRDALDRVGIGPVTKAFFSFDSAFWSPRRAFWVADDPPSVFELWVDVSGVRGGPTLCAFAVGDHATRVESMTEDELLTAGRAALRSATGLVR